MAVYGIAHGLGKALLLLLLLLYTHWFPPELYGVIDLITVLLAFSSSVGSLQMAGSSGRYFYEISEERRGNLFYSSAIIISICTLIICMMVFAFAGSLSQLLFGNNDYISLIRFVCLIIPLDSFFRYSVSVIRLLKKPLIYGKVYLTQTIATLTFSVLFVVGTSNDIYGVFYALLTSYVLGLAVAMYYIRKHIPGKRKWDYAYVKNALKYSLPLMPAVLSGWANQYANRFVLLGALGLMEIGLLSFAFKIAAIISMIEEVILLSWSPFVFESLKKDNHKELYRIAFLKLSSVILMVAVVFILILPELTSLMAPEEYLVTVNTTILVVIAFAIKAMQPLVFVGFGISKKTQHYSYLSILSLFVNVGLLLFLVPKWGIIGAGMSILVSSLVRFIIGWYMSEKLYEVNFSVKGILPYFLVLGCITIMMMYLPVSFPVRISLALLTGLITTYCHRAGIVNILFKRRVE